MTTVSFENAFLPSDATLIHITSKTIGVTSGYISSFASNSARIQDLSVSTISGISGAAVTLNAGLLVTGPLRLVDASTGDVYLISVTGGQLATSLVAPPDATSDDSSSSDSCSESD